MIEAAERYDSLNASALEEFGEALLAEATYADPPWLIIDLTRTVFVGSSFIELLIQAWRRVRQRKGKMALCGVQPFCAEVLHTTRLDTIWSIYPTRAEAVAALRGA